MEPNCVPLTRQGSSTHDDVPSRMCVGEKRKSAVPAHMGLFFVLVAALNVGAEIHSALALPRHPPSPLLFRFIPYLMHSPSLGSQHTGSAATLQRYPVHGMTLVTMLSCIRVPCLHLSCSYVSQPLPTYPLTRLLSLTPTHTLCLSVCLSVLSVCLCLSR